MFQLKFTATDEGIRLLLALVKKYMFSFCGYLSPTSVRYTVTRAAPQLRRGVVGYLPSFHPQQSGLIQSQSTLDPCNWIVFVLSTLTPSADGIDQPTCYLAWSSVGWCLFLYTDIIVSFIFTKCNENPFNNCKLFTTGVECMEAVIILFFLEVKVMRCHVFG
jgi:hypothetical protein